MSGEMCKPYSSMSSPVLAMTVRLSAGITAASPSKSLAAPMPRAKAVSFRRGRGSGAGGWSEDSSISVFPFLKTGTARRLRHQPPAGPWPPTPGPRSQAHDAIARRLNLVAAVDADGQHRHALDGAGAVERTGVNRPQAFDEADGFDHSGSGFFVVARHQNIAIEFFVRVNHQGRRLGLEGRDHGDRCGGRAGPWPQ